MPSRLCIGLSITAAVLVVVAITVTLVVLLVPWNTDPVVETSVGSIRGRRATDGDYDVYLGIPYAQVDPSNHFGASTPHPTFSSVFDATDDSARCPQMAKDSNLGHDVPVGSIDCLQLNIFVPDAADDTRLPVMVWIDGNDFETNWKSSSRYGPKYLIEQGVIYVSINYRVGPYGFMCLNTPSVPGNQGLKDQVLALRWIRDNIEPFGGDVNRITVFGSSAGGSSIDFHLLSDTEVLFNKAIMQSGTSLTASVFAEHVTIAPIIIALQLGFATNSVNEALSHLSSLNSNSVIQAWKDTRLVFKPCTENVYNNVEPFLSRPWVSANATKAQGIPILIGHNDQEQLLKYLTLDAFEGLNVVQDRLQQTFDFSQNQLSAMDRNVRSFYFADRVITSDLKELPTNFDSDFTYAHPVQRSINRYLVSGAQNVFYYIFSYNGGRNVAHIPEGVSSESAAHGDEVGYLFDMELLPENPSAQDQQIIDRMTTMWTNFAKYSDPTPETSALLPQRWTPINASYNYFTIDSDLALGRRPNFNRMSFWDLFYKYNAGDQKEFAA